MRERNRRITDETHLLTLCVILNLNLLDHIHSMTHLPQLPGVLSLTEGLHPQGSMTNMICTDH
jgi:hypothetical protein